MNKIFDLHCDTPYNIVKGKFNHIDPYRLHQQNYCGAVFAHFVYPKAKHPFVDAVKMIAATRAYVDRQKRLQWGFRELARGKTVIVFGVEGGHIFDAVFGQVEALYGLGARVFTMTWNNSNRLARSALEADKRGLTRQGKEYVRRMKQYDICLDMSHASTRTVLDVCDIWEGKIIASHSCVRKLNPSFLRNISDRAIAAIVERGGVVGVNFSKHHLGQYGVAEHIDYLCQEHGVSCAAIGSDFDGITDPVIANPRGIGGLEKQLARKGYTRKDIGSIFSGNFLRLLRKT